MMMVSVYSDSKNDEFSVIFQLLRSSQVVW